MYQRSLTIRSFLITGLIILASMMFCSIANAASNAKLQPDNLFPQVKISTSMGDIVVELDRMRAPITVDNFLTYVVNHEYDGNIFHRVIPGFVVQGGGYDTDMQPLPTRESIINESGNGLKNEVGTIAMARENDPHSARRQFYFNMADNANLDPNPRHWGYTVFGHVVEGDQVLEAIAQVKTHVDPLLGWPDVPEHAVLIKKVELLPEAQ